VRDLWPEFAISMGVIKNPVLIALGHWLEKFLYARATHILVNSPAYKEYLVAKGVPDGKITFIPYGTDIDMFNPNVDGSSVREKLGLQDKFMVLYAGAMGQAHDLYTVLRAQTMNDLKSLPFLAPVRNASTWKRKRKGLN
jgi:glycosyltransferase involved in cell wall biosynthesis